MRVWIRTNNILEKCFCVLPRLRLIKGEKTKKNDTCTHETNDNLLTLYFRPVGACASTEGGSEGDDEEENPNGGKVRVAVRGKVEIELYIISFPKSCERGEQEEDVPSESEERNREAASGNPGDREETDREEEGEEETDISKG